MFCYKKIKSVLFALMHSDLRLDLSKEITAFKAKCGYAVFPQWRMFYEK